jgi:hypothetical protein
MGDKGLKTVAVPSVVGIGALRSVEFGLGIAAQGRDAGRPLPHVIKMDDVSYLVGAGVENFAQPIERMDLARFADSPELRALLFVALAKLGAQRKRLALNVGLPVEVVMDKPLLADVARGMDRWLTGHHFFSMDGNPVELDVATVRAKYSQPAGALFDYVYGDDLQVRNRLKGNWVLVIDEGFNTLDVVATGDQQQKVSGGARRGMRHACETLIESVARRYHVYDLGLAEADQLVRAVVEGKRATVQVRGKPTDVTAEARQALDALAAEVVRFVESRIGVGGRFDILLTGGGALALQERLTRRWPHARMAGDDPVMSNARGFWKIGMTRDQLAADGEIVVGVDPGFGSVKLAAGG